MGQEYTPAVYIADLEDRLKKIAVLIDEMEQYPSDITEVWEARAKIRKLTYLYGTRI